MADFIIINHDNDCGDDYLMHAHLNLKIMNDMMNRIVVLSSVCLTNGKNIAVQSQIRINICRCIVAP